MSDRPLNTKEILAREHERGFEAGYSAAIHDATVEGSRAHAAIIEKKRQRDERHALRKMSDQD